MDLVGQVEGCDCILVDDMIDTAGTLCSAADELQAMGARSVYAYATHGCVCLPGARSPLLLDPGSLPRLDRNAHAAPCRLFNSPAVDRIEDSVRKRTGSALPLPGR